MPRGGKRPGAGKPKGHKHSNTLAAEIARAALIQGIHDRMVPLLDAWADKALGFYEEREVVPGSGVVKVYKKGPDANAIRDMLDRAMGKPVQPIAAEVNTKVDLSKRTQDLLGKLKPLHDDKSGQTHRGVADSIKPSGDPGAPS